MQHNLLQRETATELSRELGVDAPRRRGVERILRYKVHPLFESAPKGRSKFVQFITVIHF